MRCFLPLLNSGLKCSYVFCDCAAEGNITDIHTDLHCVGLFGMLKMDDTEEQGILGTVE